MRGVDKPPPLTAPALLRRALLAVDVGVPLRAVVGLISTILPGPLSALPNARRTHDPLATSDVLVKRDMRFASQEFYGIVARDISGAGGELPPLRPPVVLVGAPASTGRLLSK